MSDTCESYTSRPFYASHSLNNLSPDKVCLYFVGICGTGMSGLAILAKSKGYEVYGSDLSEGGATHQLLSMHNIKITSGHKNDNITLHCQKCEKIHYVVKSTAIAEDNPDIQTSSKKGITILSRGEMLSFLMSNSFCVNIAGTHGKTTLTCMIATCMVDSGEISSISTNDSIPTVINGGIMRSYNSNIIIGNNDTIIAEADESDGTFLILPANICIITNVSKEHMNYYKNENDVLDAYVKFIKNAKKNDGNAIVCGDDFKLVDAIRNSVNNETKSDWESFVNEKIITYGLGQNNDVIITNYRPSPTYEGMIFDIEIKPNDCTNVIVNRLGNEVKNIFVRAYGKHNILNATASLLVCTLLKKPLDKILIGLNNYQGVERRFSQISLKRNIHIIDDYAHHPREIEATIEAAKILQKKIAFERKNKKYIKNNLNVQNAKDENYDIDDNYGRIILIFQPHRYSRLTSLMDEFASSFALAEVDKLVITEVYSAHEEGINRVSAEILYQNIITKLSEFEKMGIKKTEKTKKETEKIKDGKTAENIDVMESRKRIEGRIKKDDIMMLHSIEKLQELIENIAMDGDIVLCLGAGDISKYTNKLVL